MGFAEALEKIVEVVRVDGRLEITEHLVLVIAEPTDKLLFFILGLDVGLALFPAKRREGEEKNNIKLEREFL